MFALLQIKLYILKTYFGQANVPHTECQNGCCESQSCLNGGTCHETCDVTGKRFTCSCKPHFTGRFCETGKSGTNTCFPWLFVRCSLKSIYQRKTRDHDHFIFSCVKSISGTSPSYLTFYRFAMSLCVIFRHFITSHMLHYRGFGRQPYCMAATMKMFCIRKNIFSYRKKNLLFLPCNMAAVQKLYTWSVNFYRGKLNFFYYASTLYILCYSPNAGNCSQV